MKTDERKKERQVWIKNYMLDHPGTRLSNMMKEFKGGEDSRTLQRDLFELVKTKDLNYDPKSRTYSISANRSIMPLEQALAHSNSLIKECLPFGTQKQKTKLLKHYSSEEISLYVLQAVSLNKDSLLAQHLKSGTGDHSIGRTPGLEQFIEIYQRHYANCVLDHHVLMALLLDLPESEDMLKQLRKCMGDDCDYLNMDLLPGLEGSISQMVMRLRYGVPIEGVCHACY